MEMINVSICLTDIPKEAVTLAKNGKKYINIIVSKRKEKDQYGSTHTVFISQTKEQRDKKEQKIYVGNGKKLGVDIPDLPDIDF